MFLWLCTSMVGRAGRSDSIARLFLTRVHTDMPLEDGIADLLMHTRASLVDPAVEVWPVRSGGGGVALGGRINLWGARQRALWVSFAVLTPTEMRALRIVFGHNEKASVFGESSAVHRRHRGTTRTYAGYTMRDRLRAQLDGRVLVQQGIVTCALERAADNDGMHAEDAIVRGRTIKRTVYTLCASACGGAVHRLFDASSAPERKALWPLLVAMVHPVPARTPPVDLYAHARGACEMGSLRLAWHKDEEPWCRDVDALSTRVYAHVASHHLADACALCDGAECAEVRAEDVVGAIYSMSVAWSFIASLV